MREVLCDSVVSRPAAEEFRDTVMTPPNRNGLRATGTVVLLCIAFFAGNALASSDKSTAAVKPIYSPQSFWNTPIARDAPVDPDSGAMLAASVLPFASTANFSNGDNWGVPVIYATPEAKTYVITCTRYCETGRTISFRIPAGARPSTGSDHHLAVIDGTRELDLWLARYDPGTDAWSAGTFALNQVNGVGASCPEGSHCNGAVAAGFALLGGLVRPQEMAAGEVRHALALVVPRTRAGFIACPATHTDGNTRDTRSLPEGARLQLDPAFDVEAQPWPAWEKTLAHALQRYGAYVVDTGGSVSIRGVADMSKGDWAAARTPKQASLADFPWQRMKVLQIRSCN